MASDARTSSLSIAISRSFIVTEPWSEDLLAVLDAVGSTSAAVFAEAEAGATAVLFAAAHPERVNALVLGNTQARWAVADDYPIGLDPVDIESFVELIETTWGTPEGLAVALPSLAGDAASLRLLARLCRAAATPRTAGALYRHILSELDVRHMLGLVQVPTLVIHNEYTDTNRARYLADGIEGARLIHVPGNDMLFFGGDLEPVMDAVTEFLTGERPAVEIDRILTTVMFTDIVASTERAAAEGDQRWRNLLDAHDRAVRSELARFRGKEIKTTGDGFLAAFDGPTRAIHCAQAIT
jgi:pimeloyl-ACP methyl ester carboxylesterase